MTNCEGVLIAPLVVLTAQHCLDVIVDGSRAILAGRERVQLIPGSPPEDVAFEVRLPLDPASAKRFFSGAGLAPAESDFALVFVKEAGDGGQPFAFETLPREILRTHVRRPSFIRNAGQVFIVNHEFSSELGVRQRKVAFWDNAIQGGGRVSTFERSDGKEVRISFGDSGSPIFTWAADGSRDVFALVTEHDNAYNVGATVAGNPIGGDLTQPTVKAWIEQNARDTSRSAEWLQKHGKTDHWFGEVDYMGACRVDVDRDCDGWFDDHDDCPDTYDPVQLDLDLDGVGDVCDNCRKTFNPNQANCNAEFEAASRERGAAVETLGDVCDPVPCPKAASGVSRYTPGITIPSSCIDGPQSWREIKDEIRITPIGPGVKDPPFPVLTPAAIAIDDVPTKARFCHTSSTHNVDCSLPAVLRDTQLNESIPAGQPSEPNPSDPWHRITLKRGADGAWVSRDSNAGFSLRYFQDSPFPFFWDYLADDAFWHRNGLDVVGSGAPGAACSKNALFGLGTCLDGRLWTHADSPIGHTVDTAAGTFVGVHGPDLANHAFDLRPDEPHAQPGCEAPVLDPCIANPASCASGLLYRLQQCIMCQPIPHMLGVDRMQLPVARGHGQAHFVVWQGVLASAENVLSDYDVRQAVAARNFYSAVEATAPSAGEVDAVAFPASTLHGDVTEYLSTTSSGDGLAWSFNASSGSMMMSTASMSSSLDVTFEPEPDDASRRVLDRLDARVVYSRTMQGAFVVSGRDASTGELMTSVIYEPLHSNRYTLTGSIGAEVLAATLTRPSTIHEYAAGSAMPSFLWTVERNVDTNAVSLVVREITRDSVGVPLHAIVLANDPGDTYFLAIGLGTEDTAVLSVSNATEHRWGAFQVGGFLGGDCSFDETACLVVRPLFDGASVPYDSYLLRGIYLEPDAFVLPLLEWTDAHARFQLSAERRRRGLVTPQPSISPLSLRDWLQ